MKIKKRGRPKKVADNNPRNEDFSQISILSNDDDSDDNILGISDYNSSDEDNVSTISSSEKIKELERKNRELDNIINNYKKLINDNDYNKKYTESFSKLVNFKLVDNVNGKEIIIEKTNIHCWWCAHKFDNFPCFIPTKFENGVYHVYGIFCTPNCACAYNLSKNDYKKYDKNSLLIKFYSEIIGNIVDIKPAPDKEVLVKFGGTVNINEYRNSSINMDVTYRFNVPPFKPIYPFIDCEIKTNISKIDSKDLVLKRSKPFKDNTIFKLK